MVLLIPKTVRAILEKGRAEGKVEEREAQSQRVNEVYERFGIEVDGTRVLPDTPEVKEFLRGDSPEKSTDSK